MDISKSKQFVEELTFSVISWANDAEFYSQLGLVVLAVLLTYTLSVIIVKNTPILKNPPKAGAYFEIRNVVYKSRKLLFPLLTILALSMTVDLGGYLVKKIWLIQIFESLAVVFMVYSLISRIVDNVFLKNIVKWVVIPISVLHVFGWLDAVITYLESMSLEIGNINISAYGVVRVFIFGVILFWLGRITNRFGQKAIRGQENIDLGTREVFAKLFQVVLFTFIFILLLQVMGINLTALAVFGGALGVGLGFGLQSIASNFISGIILLLDRSLSVGDYIELADGQKGTIRQLNMRSTLLETYDGKDIMVPNEQFITTSFINWTHKNKKQRYSLEFSVAYNTDLHKLFKLLREVVASHPKVLSGPGIPVEELPDAEICNFGDSGVGVLIEFWMDGIDDGRNRVGGDLLLMIWDALKEQGIEIPYPQREVKILSESSQGGPGF